MFLGELLKYFGTFALSLKAKHDTWLKLRCEFKGREENRKVFSRANRECGFSHTQSFQSTEVAPAPKHHALLWLALMSLSLSGRLQRRQGCSERLRCTDALKRSWHRTRYRSRQVQRCDICTAVGKLLLAADLPQLGSGISTRHHHT